jgi:hypothetical protein
MTKGLVGAVALVVLLPAAGHAQDVLEAAARALGVAGVKSIQITGAGSNLALGQSHVSGARWPRFNVRTFTRTVNTPGAAGAPAATAASASAVNLADPVARLRLAVDRIVPLHGGRVPFAEPARSIGRAP